MAARPKWKGTLTIGLVSVPVHLFATSDKKSSAPVGHGVHRGYTMTKADDPVEGFDVGDFVPCMTQASNKKWCTACDKEISEDELMRGYDVPAGLSGPKLHVPKCKAKDGEQCLCPTAKFIELEDTEIADLKVDSTKTIHITKTADASELEPLMIADTAFLVSDGTASAAEAEAILIEAMRGKVGIGTLVMSGRERHVAVMVYGEGLLMHVLRTADQMKAFPDRVRLPQAPPQMVALAKQLVDAMEAPLDLTDTVDAYAEGLKKLVASKSGGEALPVAAAEAPKKVSSLMDALMASVKNVPAKAAPAKADLKAPKADKKRKSA